MELTKPSPPTLVHRTQRTHVHAYNPVPTQRKQYQPAEAVGTARITIKSSSLSASVELTEAEGRGSNRPRSQNRRVQPASGKESRNQWLPPPSTTLKGSGESLVLVLILIPIQPFDVRFLGGVTSIVDNFCVVVLVDAKLQGSTEITGPDKPNPRHRIQIGSTKARHTKRHRAKIEYVIIISLLSNHY
ncbi:hypothetical protein CVT24_007170 [Panaeolus cyanescens]|uniref:Uncharacterized protein n=1 Tax=Panaeolus cyanescens TaxID=181874 RepID=A0A409YPJ5_9AGAR|nr:hypothetical protein CVT24_007170 [Panaeolus cyanescens]